MVHRLVPGKCCPARLVAKRHSCPRRHGMKIQLPDGGASVPGCASHAISTSTVAPWSSSCFLSLAASSLLTPSLDGLHRRPRPDLSPPCRPRPVMAAPPHDDVDLLLATGLQNDSELRLLLAAAGAAAAAAAAIATGAAAETPHLSSRSLRAPPPPERSAWRGLPRFCQICHDSTSFLQSSNVSFRGAPRGARVWV